MHLDYGPEKRLSACQCLLLVVQNAIDRLLKPAGILSNCAALMTMARARSALASACACAACPLRLASTSGARAVRAREGCMGGGPPSGC